MVLRSLRLLIIVAVVILAYIHLRPHFGDFEEFPRVLREANLYFVAAVLFSIIGQYAGDAWLSKMLLEIAGRKIDFRLTMQIASLDVLAANMLSLGETGVMVTAGYFYRRLGVTNQQFIFLTVAWGSITNIVFAIYLLLSLLLLPAHPHLSFDLPRVILLVLIPAAVLVLIGFAVMRQRIYRLFWRYVPKYPVLREVAEFVRSFPSHRRLLLENKPKLAQGFVGAVLYYSANIAALYFSFAAFHVYPSVPLVAFAFLISIITSAITLAPGGLGTAEATMIVLFLQYDLSPTVVTAAVLLFRLTSFWIPLPAGLISYIWLKRHSSPAQVP